MKIQEILAEVFEHVHGTWRFRWWAAGITWLIAIGGGLFVYSLPNIYQASARIYIDTNSLLKPLMQGLTAQNNTMNEVQLVQTVMLTRPNLEAVARQTDLALRARSPEQFEALITDLQRRITFGGGRENVFTIQYQDESKEKARDVVAAILDTFVEGAIGAQGDDAEVTERALAGEIQEHEERLRTMEVALAEFQRDNVGYMPGETGDYYSRLQTALSARDGTEERIRQLVAVRDELRRQLEGEEPIFGIMSSSGSVADCAQSGQLLKLQGELAAVLVGFTEKYPQAVALKEQIRNLEERCAADQGNAPPRASVPAGESLKVNPVYQDLRKMAAEAEVELVEAQSQLRSHKNTVEALQRDVERIADVETQLKQLNRDYDVVKMRHQELLKRWEDLQAKKRLDPVTDNVQFRRIDPPFALAEPAGPNRLIFAAGVLVLALAAGGGAAFGLNLIRPVFFSRHTVQRISGLPVLGSVSMLLSPAVMRRRKLEGLACGASYLALLTAAAIVLVFSRDVTEFVHGLMGGFIA